MNWNRVIIKTVAYFVFCIVIDAITKGVSQIGINYMATYQMSNTVDSSFWIQIVPHISLLGFIVAVLFGIFVFKNEIKYIWNYDKSKESKENEKV